MLLEMAAFNEQMLYNPGDISRKKWDVVVDAATCWRELDHTTAVTGHKSNGLTTSLDGEEDILMNESTAQVWRDLNLYALRRESEAEIKSKVERGELAWNRESIRAVRPLWGSLGSGAFAHEGAELEAAQEEDEKAWLDEGARVR